MPDNRKRVWWFILYPESAPEDWLEQLKSLMVPFAVSPCHDKDIGEDGHLLKAHYHVLFHFTGKKSYEQILQITRMLNQPRPEFPLSFDAAYEYLWHKNNPEKFQYSHDDVQHFNGFKVPSLGGELNGDIALKKQVCDYVRKNNVLEFSDLIFMLMSEEGCDDLLLEVYNNTYFYTQFVNSFRYVHQRSLDRYFDEQQETEGRFIKAIDGTKPEDYKQMEMF